MRSCSITSGAYACRSTDARFGDLIFSAGLISRPRSSVQKRKNDLMIASRFRRVAGDASPQCSSRKSRSVSVVNSSSVL
jgi:hypothetical protein